MMSSINRYYKFKAFLSNQMKELEEELVTEFICTIGNRVKYIIYLLVFCLVILNTDSTILFPPK